jgi:hypothetical protein
MHEKGQLFDNILDVGKNETFLQHLTRNVYETFKFFGDIFKFSDIYVLLFFIPVSFFIQTFCSTDSGVKICRAIYL